MFLGGLDNTVLEGIWSPRDGKICGVQRFQGGLIVLFVIIGPLVVRSDSV